MYYVLSLAWLMELIHSLPRPSLSLTLSLTLTLTHLQEHILHVPEAVSNHAKDTGTTHTTESTDVDGHPNPNPNRDRNDSTLTLAIPPQKDDIPLSFSLHPQIRLR